MKDDSYLRKTIAISGGFDPLHVGHLRMLQNAKKLVGESGKLVIIVNDDDYLLRKKGRFFMPQAERAEILSALECVDETYEHKSTFDHVNEALEIVKPDLFGNGGDIVDIPTIAEYETCQKLGIEMIVGLEDKEAKEKSSSDLHKRYSETNSN